MLQQLKILVRTNLTQSIPWGRRNMPQKPSSSKGGKVPEHIKRAQKLFQEKNNLPVFLKGGKTDRILYYSTLGLAGTGLLCSLAFFAEYIID